MTELIRDIQKLFMDCKEQQKIALKDSNAAACMKAGIALGMLEANIIYRLNRNELEEEIKNKTIEAVKEELRK